MIDEVLEVVKEPENEYDPSAVAIKRNNGLSSYVVGHIGRHISKVVFQFLSLPGSAATATVSDQGCCSESHISYITYKILDLT